MAGTFNGITIPDSDDDRTLRIAELRGTKYLLHTWDTRRTDPMGKSIVGAAFWHVEHDEPIFCTEDFGASPMHAIDSDEMLRAILGFFTLGKGDTDPDYFADYTPRQVEFRDGPDREYLSMWSVEPSDDEQPEWYAFDDRDADRW